MKEERKWLTSAQAARALDVDPSTLWRWQQAGRVRPAWVTPGGQARWELAELHQQLGIHARGEHVPEDATQPERQPVVAAIVTSERGVLIGRRNDGKPPWTFIAGEIEPGESQADAAVREVKEETGLVVEAGAQEIGRRVHPKTGRTMIYLACTPVGKLDVFVGDEDELAEVKWASLTEVEEAMNGMIFDPVHAHLIRELSS